MAQLTSPPPAGATPCFYEHTAQSIIPHLASQMPYSSSLLRRIQHALAYPSSTAKILATFPPGSTPALSATTDNEPGSSSPGSDPSLSSSTPWLAARVDLFRGRETQIILYSSLEAECTSLPLIDPVTTVSPSDLSRYSGPAAGIGAAANANAMSHPHASGQIRASISQERPSSSSNPNYAVASFTANRAKLDTARNQLLAFLAYVKTNLLPEYLSSLSKEDGGKSGPSAEASASPSPSAAGVSQIPPPDPHAFLIGTFHTGLFELLLQSGKYPRASVTNGHVNASGPVNPDPLPGLRIHRYDNPPYYKYFFTRAVFESGLAPETETPLPEGYRYHDRRGRVGVLSSQLDLVQSRTHIPRPRRQLQTLPSVAIYYDADGSVSSSGVREDPAVEEEMPIAWAFLGVDGAVATLHVEPDHRGRGLAVPLSKEVMRRGMATKGIFGAEKLGVSEGEMKGQVEDWVHAEVAGYNWASRRVMEKIGGKVLTTVMWTVVEVLD